jgi:uncharacterized repeat protein (TIGR02543 family)
MKKKWNVIGIIIMVMIIGLMVLGCENPSGGGKDKDDDTPSDPVFYTVKFESNGGSAVDDIPVESGNTITLPAEPTRGIDTFDGWYTDNNTFANAFTTSTTVSADITVYAKWIKVYAIGDTGPAGGIIFYVKESASDGWQYLEAAPKSTEIKKTWASTLGTRDDYVMGLASALGLGDRNTQRIVNFLNNLGQSDRAAHYCNDLVFGEKDDWYLPNATAVEEMYNNLYCNGFGEFANDDWYWSSTEGTALNDDSEAAALFFSTSLIEDDDYKSSDNYVRAIRKF